jgi:hypothetical protein
MKLLQLKSVFILLGLFLLISPTLSQIDSLVNKPLGEGKARIIFTRKASMLGAIVPHLVIDRCDSLQRNAFIMQDKMFPLDTGNFDVRGNVNKLYWILGSRENFLLSGFGSEDDVRMKKDSVFNRIKSKTMLPFGINKLFKSLIAVYFNSKSLPSNVYLAGIVKSGQTFAWDRDPGLLKLEVFTLGGGDHAFAPVFTVEAGKMYEVIYNYPKARFEIKALEK